MILTEGSGTRLYPESISKPLLTIYGSKSDSGIVKTIEYYLKKMGINV